MGYEEAYQYSKHYQLYPHLYTDEDKNAIETHANFYGIPIYREHTSGLLGVVKNTVSKGE